MPVSMAAGSDGASVGQVSKYNLDATDRLEDTLAKAEISWRELLAEVQAAFVLFLVAASFPALE